MAALGGLFFLPVLGGVHLFDWDEINFAEAAREMLATGEWLRVQINYQPFWEKPPVFFWMQALSMKWWGVGEYAARFPNAIAGISSLLLLFYLGKKWKSASLGWLWAMAYLGSILPHLYAKSGIIDPWFNLFIFSGLALVVDAVQRRKMQQSVLWQLAGSAVCIGLAILTKGPVGGAIPLLVIAIVFLWDRFRWSLPFYQYLAWGVGVLAVTALWFGVDIMQNGWWFTEEFIRYQIRLLSTEDAGHGGFLGYHFVVLLLGVFPASIWALRGFGTLPLSEKETLFRRWMLVLFWVVIILFSIVQSKIVHYSSLCYFPLTYLAASTLEQIVNGKIKLPTWQNNLVLGMGILFSLVLIIVPWLGQHISSIQFLFEKDAFALANLEADVTWTYGHCLPGIWLLLASLFFYINIKKATTTQKKRRLFTLHFLAIGLFVNLALIAFINNIEGYSQRAAIEFYESKIGEEVYLQPMGYKSYAHLFYQRKEQGGNPKQWDKNWLLHGDIDRDVYFVTKISKKKSIEAIQHFERVGERNGFVFYKRAAK